MRFVFLLETIFWHISIRWWTSSRPGILSECEAVRDLTPQQRSGLLLQTQCGRKYVDTSFNYWPQPQPLPTAVLRLVMDWLTLKNDHWMPPLLQVSLWNVYPARTALDNCKCYHRGHPTLCIGTLMKWHSRDECKIHFLQALAYILGCISVSWVK